MFEVVNRPGLLLVLVGIVLWAVAWLGAIARRRHPIDAEQRGDFTLLLSSALTLLALIVGFSFSFVSNRYDQRKTFEEAEANAIGTEYVRADLLPKQNAEKVKRLLKEYTLLRIDFYTNNDADALHQLNAKTSRVQGELWNAVLGPAEASPTPVMALAVAGMNDVLNSQGFTQAAWTNRMPISSWAFLLSVALCCNFLIGYGLQSTKSEKRLLFIFPVLLTLALTFIGDIDSPRRGVIRVHPQNLVLLLETMKGP
jgi:hypothetical protein